MANNGKKKPARQPSQAQPPQERTDQQQQSQERTNPTTSPTRPGPHAESRDPGPTYPNLTSASQPIQQALQAKISALTQENPALQPFKAIISLIIPVFEQVIKTTIQEEFERIKEKEKAGKLTYAAITAAGIQESPQKTPQALPTPPLPTKNSKEILVKTGPLPPNLANRSTKEVIEAINIAAAAPIAKALRLTPKGVTVIATANPTAKNNLEKNPQWLEKAFGPSAEIIKPSYALAIKGLQVSSLQGISDDILLQEIQSTLPGACRAKIWRPNDPSYRAKVLIATTDVNEANKACNDGLIWRYQLYNCEPYLDSARPLQCFQCWKWGHISRNCKKTTPVCQRCNTSRHTDPGNNCQRASRCPNCNGNHSARSPDCPEYIDAHRKASEAYINRPRSFATTTTNPGPIVTLGTPAVFSSPEGPSDTLYPPRKRGRPSYIESDTLQRKISDIFSTTPSTQGSQPNLTVTTEMDLSDPLEPPTANPVTTPE